ncbi:MAG: acyl-CoA thioesterase [Pseudomonadota bacterium]
MYPALRMSLEMWRAGRLPALNLTDTHISHHRCWPWDIDAFIELNHGRALTLYDLGRIPLARRVGLVDVLKRKKWGLTMAGAHVRYRRRVRPFEKVEMRSRGLCWDARFIYIEQSMWKIDGECASHILYRSAVTGKSGIIPPAEVLAELNMAETQSPEMPDWVSAWIEAEATRPWPPNM